MHGDQRHDTEHGHNDDSRDRSAHAQWIGITRILEDVCWSDQGRRSIDAVILAACLGGLILLHFEFWHDVGRAI